MESITSTLPTSEITSIPVRRREALMTQFQLYNLGQAAMSPAELSAAQALLPAQLGSLGLQHA